VHQVTSPTKNAVSVRARDIGVGFRCRDSVHRKAQPRVEEVITSTRDGYGPLLTEAGLAGTAAEAYWHLGEPSRFTNFANEVCNGIRTAVQILLLFIIGGKIDKT